MVIFVTGGSRGIGKIILSYFSKNKSIRAINISKKVSIGELSLVNKNINSPGVYSGIPVKKINEK